MDMPRESYQSLRNLRNLWITCSAATALAGAACGGTPATIPADPTATPPVPPLPLSQAFVLESWGAPAEDTTVVFPANEGRVVVLRRGPPDNNVFVRIVFPADTGSAAADSVRLSIAVRPGLYGIDLSTDAPIDSAQVTFSYAMHFVAPAGAREAYDSEYRFERFLGIARIEGESTLVFLNSSRPASDLLTAPLTEAGRYLVAAPRTAPVFRSIIW
jgi:hypothetical protein